MRRRAALQLSLLALSCAEEQEDMRFGGFGFPISGIGFGAPVGGGDVTAPVLASITTNTAGDEITLTYTDASGVLDVASEPATSAYALTSDGAAVALTSLNVTGLTVVLVPAVAIAQGADVRLAYTAPGSGKVQDAAGNAAAAFSATAVTNNSTRTPAVTLSGKTFRWLEAGLGETTTADSGGGASDAGGGGGNYVLDALADQGPGGYNTLQTTSARPRIEDKGFNGRRCFAGDGVDDRVASTGTSIASTRSGTNIAWTRLTTLQAFLQGATLIPWSYGANATSPFMELFFSSTNLFTVRKNAGANVDATSVANSTLDRLMVLVECVGSTISVEVNGVAVISGASFSNGSMTFDRDAMMCLRRNTITNFGPMRVGLDVDINGTISAAEKAELYAYGRKWIASQSAPLLCMTGDSHLNTDIGETSWMTLLQAEFPNATLINNGIVGDTLVNMLSKNATSATIYRYADSNYDAGRSFNVYGNHYGANDIEGVSSRTAVQLRTDQTTWATAVKGRRPSAILVGCTLHKIPSLVGVPAKEAERVAYNTDMRANYLSYGFDYLLDKDLIITEDGGDPAVYDSGDKHLNATGEAYLVNGRFGVDGMKQILQAIGF
jgi:hypothetical protein